MTLVRTYTSPKDSWPKDIWLKEQLAVKINDRKDRWSNERLTERTVCRMVPAAGCSFSHLPLWPMVHSAKRLFGQVFLHPIALSAKYHSVTCVLWPFVFRLNIIEPSKRNRRKKWSLNTHYSPNVVILASQGLILDTSCLQNNDIGVTLIFMTIFHIFKIPANSW